MIFLQESYILTYVLHVKMLTGHNGLKALFGWITYRLDGQVCLKSGVVNHFMDKKKVDNTKINKKSVNNTNFKTNLTVQAVCPLFPKPVRNFFAVSYSNTALVSNFEKFKVIMYQIMVRLFHLKAFISRR